MTLYLKYRPQILKDLDQEKVRTALVDIVKSGNIPHALLFSGPKGTGKTSAARIIAKIANCENIKKGQTDPCNECDQCISITAGSNIDVIELDAASHRGIDDIRQIRDAVKLSPAKAKKKVYIIDEAHMLTTEASNALLKTLEEPPDHVIFILATTNPEKIIDTIRSRATNIAFKKASTDELVNSVSKIAKSENIEVDKETLKVIAQAADGAFRDAIKIFEQLSVGKSKLTKEDVENLITSQKVFSANEFIDILLKRETKKALQLLDVSVSRGANIREVHTLILDYLRNILLAKVGVGESADLDINKDELIQLIKLFSESSERSAYSVLEQLPIEVAIIEWCEEIAGRGNNLTDRNNDQGSSKQELRNDSKREETQIKVNNVSEEPAPAKKQERAEEKKTNGSSIKTGSISQDEWNQILSKVKPGHASTEALLRAAKPLEFDGATLKLGVYYKFHKEHLEGSPHRDVLEDALSTYLGNSVRVICTLTEPPAVSNKSDNMTNGEPKMTDGEILLTEPKDNRNFSQGSPLTQSSDNDIIKIAEKIFSS